ncbi:MAG: hypothetical protein Q4A54_03590 [Parabacteroides sp.]|nr:hypothetical protein [Parabacteroides sp.]
MYKFILWGLSVFCLLSCSLRKTTSKADWHVDSMCVNKRLSVHTVAVPASQATLQIPLPALQALPKEAFYRTENKQAAASVQVLHDTLFVTALCDSLQQLVYTYQSERSNYRQSETIQESRKEWFSHKWLYGFMGFLLGILFKRILKTAPF